MTNPSPRLGKTAAVTGAASGIGKAFCRKLAALGYDLILIDRSAAAGDLGAALKAEFAGIEVEAVAGDLTHREDLERVAEGLTKCATLELLVNSAGFGTCGNFLEIDYAPQEKMIELHVLASARLCRAALPGMVARNSGGVINIASVSAFTRFPEAATYTATKCFLVAFTECLETELKAAGASNVRVQALCPGNTRTAFNDTAMRQGFDPSRLPAFMWMDPDTLADLSLKALARGSGTYIPLFRNQLYCFVFSNKLIIRILALLRKLGISEVIFRILRSAMGRS